MAWGKDATLQTVEIIKYEVVRRFGIRASGLVSP
jgi:hypothetical protein